MPPLPPFSLPLPTDGPPDGYGWADTPASSASSITAFNTGLDARDRFGGQKRCIVCGDLDPLEPCHIVPQGEQTTWRDLKKNSWLPRQAKDHPANEPRNGMLMCPNHLAQFHAYLYFIRYMPEARKYVFINYSGAERYRALHGKAVALDVGHPHSVFPQLLIIHEMRVRHHHPFADTEPDVPDTIAWQEWILASGAGDDASDTLKHDKPPARGHATSSRTRTQSRPSNAGTRSGPSHSAGSRKPAPSQDVVGQTFFAGSSHTNPRPNNADTELGASPSVGTHPLDLNQDVVEDILAAARAMPSWKACEIEGLRWDGTAEENMRQYMEVIGTEEAEEKEAPSS